MKLSGTATNLWLVCICAVGGSTGCDLFSTRPPQDPTQESSQYVPPTDVSIVLQNMTNAFQDANAVNYVKSFTDSSFSFEATPNARSNYGNIFSAWDKVSEQQYFEKTIRRLSPNNRVSLTITQTTLVNLGDSVQVEAGYDLTVPHIVPNMTKKFSGRAQFVFVRMNTGFFFIRRWIDYGKTSTDSTWSDLKGISSSQW